MVYYSSTKEHGTHLIIFTKDIVSNFIRKLFKFRLNNVKKNRKRCDNLLHYLIQVERTVNRKYTTKMCSRSFN